MADLFYQPNVNEQVATTSRTSHRLFVGMLKINTCMKDLQTYFGRFGPIEQIVMRRDQEHSRPYAIIEYRTENAIEQALSYWQHDHHLANGQFVRWNVDRYRARPSQPMLLC